MHQEAYDYVGRFAAVDRIDVVEVGSRDVNFTVRPHFPNANYYGIDAQPGPMVDEVADGARWRPREPVDIVVCAEVFEHTPDWRAIVRNTRHMLKPGGRVIFTCAGPGRPEHGVNIDDPLCPGHYANVSAPQLERAMIDAGFTYVEVETLGDDTRATGFAGQSDDIVVTCLLNSFPDPQRGGHWEPSLDRLTVLETVLECGLRAVVINDCLDDGDAFDGVELVRVENGIENAYFARWKHIAEYLVERDPRYVFCVDGGDVRLLNNPFGWMQRNVLYIGSEPLPSAAKDGRDVGFWWMREYHPDSLEWIEANDDRAMLNGGLLGGDAGTVIDFAEDVMRYWPTADGTDMGAVNRVAYSRQWIGRHVTGDLVHTPMWSFDESDHSWWAHK